MPQHSGSRRLRAAALSAAPLAALLIGTALRAAGPAPEDIPDVVAVVSVEKFGEFRVRFHPDEAPNHVAHFLTLASDGYYDGMSFHRVIPRFLVQAGDPASRDEDLGNDGPGGPAVRLPAEATERTHTRGTFSLAWRDGDPATAVGQWFVVLEDNPGIDGHGTPIGEVVDGMDTLDRISQVSTHRNRNPLHRVIIRSIRLEPATGAGAG